MVNQKGFGTPFKGMGGGYNVRTCALNKGYYAVRVFS